MADVAYGIDDITDQPERRLSGSLLIAAIVVLALLAIAAAIWGYRVGRAAGV